jgi:hypothetical protein
MIVGLGSRNASNSFTRLKGRLQPSPAFPGTEEEQFMKSASISKAILAVTIFLAGTAFAGDAHKGSFQLSSPTQVSGTQLPAGEYVAKWDGTGPDVQVNIVKNGKTLATVPAKLVQLNSKADQDSAELKSGSDGSRELTTLRFSGKKYALQLSPAAGTQAGEGMK